MFKKFLKKLFFKDDSYEFEPILSEIEDTPVNPLGRITFWTLMAFIFTAILILCLGKTDVVITAQSKVIPDGNIKTIQSLEIGVISSILVKEGTYVKAGETLVTIDPSVVNPALESTRKNLYEINEELKRLKNNSYKGDSRVQTTLYNAQNINLQNQISIKNSELNKTDEEISALNSQLKNNKYLLAQALDRKKRQEDVLDIISREEYEKTLSDISNYSSQNKELLHKTAELKKQKTIIKQEMSLIYSQQRKENLETALVREKEINELEAQVKEIEFKSTRQKLVSPVNGYVNTIFISTIGGVVTPAEKIMTVIPENTPLLVKATVLSKDIGFVKEGMDVSLKIETFDFQKYGLIDGTVKTVSKDSIQDEKLGLVYEVFITPKTTFLTVEGRKEELRAGMSVISEIKTSKRRIIEFFIYPIVKNLKESVSVR